MNLLAGKRIVVTRPTKQATSICGMLRERGAEVIEFPTVRIEPASDPQPLLNALRKLNSYDRVFFTSVNGVEHTWEHVQPPWPASTKVAAIGPATASALRTRHVEPDVVPSEYVAEALACSLGSVQDQTILLPRASKTRPALFNLLTQAGAKVTSVTAYETHVNRPTDDAYASLKPHVDVVTFTSGSTVEGFIQMTSHLNLMFTTACIGPITADVAIGAGLQAPIIADTYTSEGLVTAIEHYFDELEQA